MTVEYSKAIMLKTFKASVLYLKGQVIPAPVPNELIEEARWGRGIVKLVEAETPVAPVLQHADLMFDEKQFVESWIKARESKFAQFVDSNYEQFGMLSGFNLQRAISKWEKFYGVEDCPLKDFI